MWKPGFGLFTAKARCARESRCMTLAPEVVILISRRVERVARGTEADCPAKTSESQDLFADSANYSGASLGNSKLYADFNFSF